MRWSMFEKYICVGQLTVIAANGERRTFGWGEPQATIEFISADCLPRILRNPQLNLGETYMQGGWRPAEDSDLYAVLRVLRLNFEQPLAPGAISWPLRAAAAFMRSWNSIAASRRNVIHHYDLDEELFRACLDSDLHYSCAYFNGRDQQLEAAQSAKCEHIARKLCLRPGQRVLDIGSGWGGLALYLAQHYQVSVTGLTLSVEQLRVAKQRAVDLGLQDQVDFQLQDYRQLKGRYDRVVSVGMFEHVGRAAYGDLFSVVDRVLGEGGVALIHTIANQYPAKAVNPWIRRHIFPGGHIPSIGQVIPSIEAAGLVVADLECLRTHYALTLAEWHRRFNTQRNRFVERSGEEFCRMWEFYLLICQTAFEIGGLVVHNLQLQRPDAQIPVTRHYLYG
ncbi:MAG: class I SAM-dependent methyltransferase [Pseudomonadales bacterium]